jgi:hypothetical protein
MKKARRREPVEIDFVGAWERLIRRSMVRYGWSLDVLPTPKGGGILDS